MERDRYNFCRDRVWFIIESLFAVVVLLFSVRWLCFLFFVITIFVFCFLFSGLFVSSSVKILDTNLWDAVHWHARQKSSFSEALMFIVVVGDTNILAIHAIGINLSNYHWACIMLSCFKEPKNQKVSHARVFNRKSCCHGKILHC